MLSFVIGISYDKKWPLLKRFEVRWITENDKIFTKEVEQISNP